MANLQAPKGFIPTRHLSGGTPGRYNEYRIASGYADDLFQGDVVKSDGSGGVAKCAAGEAMLGVIVGFRFVDPTGAARIQKSWTGGQTVLAGSAAFALVCDDPDQLYMVQTSGDVKLTDVGQLVNIDDAKAGNSSYGLSGMAVTGAGGGENQFRVMQVLSVAERNSEGLISNTAEGQYATLEVMPANHEHRTAQVAPSSAEQ